jgi:hypothetical protein
MNRSGKRCVLYPRVSTEMQVDGFSLDGQKNSLKRFVDREEMVIVNIYEDAGKSGKSIEGRPAFKQMLNDIENGLSIDYVLIYKLSRFGRNAADILNSLEHIQSFGVNLICIEEGIDSSQTNGKIAFGRRQEKRSKALRMNTAKYSKMNIFLQTVSTMLSSARNYECPKCGGPMYTNKHALTNKDGTYKEIYYYVCSKARTARGKSCDYKAMLKKTDIEPLVIEAIRELIKNEDFAAEIKSKIGKQIDTSTLDREMKNYEGKLREVDLNKTRLENEIDSLPEDARFRERELHDMALRLDSLYDIIVELEEKKSLISSLIKEIEIFPCDESELPLKSILFNFPVYKDGGDVYEFLWDKSTTVSTFGVIGNISTHLTFSIL